MTEPDREWLVEDLARLSPLFPMSEPEYYAFLTVMEPFYGLRSLALLAERLTNSGDVPLYNDVLGVAGGQVRASDDEVAEMRRRVAATGWVPETPDG